jgi:hypothetical protein
MAKAKVVNYSEKDVEVLRTMYVGADNKAELAAISAEIGKSVPSVRSKLNSMGLYKSATQTKGAEKGEGKMDIVERIAGVVGLAEHEKDGLYKATKPALQKILDKLAPKPEAPSEVSEA